MEWIIVVVATVLAVGLFIAGIKQLSSPKTFTKTMWFMFAAVVIILVELVWFFYFHVPRYCPLPPY